MTKYIVSGYIGFDNFGDEAIARALIEKLKNKGAEKITLISSNPKKTSIVHGVNSCGMLNFLKELVQSDVLISGGGSLLQDVTSLKSLVYYLVVIYMALLLRKKVEIFAQGIGPINSVIGQFLTRFALKRVNEISVRDIKSQELLKKWGIDATLVKDPVLELQLNQQNKKGFVGVQLRDFKNVNANFLNKLADEIKKHFIDKEILVLSLQDEIDLKICTDFTELLKQHGLNAKLFHNLGINEVIEQISGLEYLIGMRFHANVIGIKSGVKTLAINYDPKVESLAEEYHLPVIDLQQENFSEEFNKLLV